MAESLNRPVVVRSLVDELVERLEHAIMTGELAGGTLVREQTLARLLKVSRGPLREAIRCLEGRKLLQRTPNVGARVVSLSLDDLKQIWIIREAMEGMACRLAATMMTDSEIADLDRIIMLQQKALKDGNWAQNYEESPEYDMHYRIAVGSRNERLTHMICQDLHYLLKVYRYRSTLSAPNRSANAIKEHKQILQALKRRDPDQAEALMRAHIRKSLENFTRNRDVAEGTIVGRTAQPSTLQEALDRDAGLAAAPAES